MARVRCEHCGRELEVAGGDAIASGWPTCCHGHTMRLQSITQPEIEEGIGQAVGDAEIVVNGETVGYGAEGMLNALGKMLPDPPPTGMR